MSESGKSCVVNLLSSLCSRNLETVSLNASSDTMDLLGGFEQADVGRSILELYDKIQLRLKCILDSLLCQGVEAGLKQMEVVVRLNSLFSSATRDKKRKHQLSALTDLIAVIKENGNVPEAEVLSAELEQVKSASKHGTFEWIESVLCRALRDGSWLLIDNVNLCSASVLDRLNALFEAGGKLTVSERGVLDGQIPEVTPHPDFRVFMLYDPSRGDISRAMRNRGVEIYIPAAQEVRFSESDRMGLISTNLDSALSSSIAFSQSLGIDYAKGLKEFSEKVSILGLQTLCGSQQLAEEATDEKAMTVEQRICWLLGSSQLRLLFPELAETCSHLLPVIEFVSSEELFRISFNFFMTFFVKSNADLTVSVISLIFNSPSLAELCRQFADNPLLVKFYSNCDDHNAAWEPRVRPSCSQAENSLANRLSLILVTYSRLKALQGRVDDNPKCLLSGSNSSFKLSSPVLEQFSVMMTALFKGLEAELNREAELTNLQWREFDSLLFWVYELAGLGLQAVGSVQEEDLERLLFVFWSWMAEKLLLLTDTLSLDLKSLFSKYQSVMESLNYDSNSFSEFRAITDLCPNPPASLESLHLLKSFQDIEVCLRNRDIISRISLLANLHGRVDSILKEVQSNSMSNFAATSKILAEYNNFSSPSTLSSSLFYRLQLVAISSRLSQVSGKLENNMFLPAKLVIMSDELRDMERRAMHNLMQCSNVDKKALTLVHNPIDLSLIEDEATSVPTNLTNIVCSVLAADAGLPLVCFEEKQEQVKGLIKLLKNFEAPDMFGSLQKRYSKEINAIVSGLLQSLGLDSSNGNIEDLFDVDGLDANVRLVLRKLAAKPLGTNLFDVHISLVLLNLCKLQIYGCLGAIDPAAKEALKYDQTLKELKYVNHQLSVMDKFKESVGANHPHRALLEERGTELKAMSESMVRRTAERGNLSFSLLSNTVKQYKDGLGSVDNLMKLVNNLETVHNCGSTGSTLAETNLWIKSSTKFASDLLDHYSFPDLVFPIVESVTSCIVSVEAAVAEINQKIVRDRCDKLDRIVTMLSDPVIPPSQDLNSFLRFCLDPTVPAFVGGNNDLKILKTVMVMVKHSLSIAPNLALPSNYLHEALSRLLTAWRKELELRERQKQEEEELFKSRTVCADVDEEKEIEAEFKAMFPSFREVFADIRPSDNLNDAMAVEEEESKPTFSAVRLDIVKDIASFMFKYIGNENDDGVLDISRHDFESRLKAMNNLIAEQVGINSPALEVALVPALISLSATMLTQGEQKKSYNFYTDPNQEECKLMKPILSVLGSCVGKLLEEFPDNPLLLQIMAVRNKILSFSLYSAISQNLTGLELLLEACQEWEKNAHRGVSVQTMMNGISSLILRWRKLELSNWKPILRQTLEALRAESCEFWLHVMGVVMESRKKTDTVRALIQFVEAASIADFTTRLEILRSVQRLMVMLGSKKRWLIAALENVHQYFSRFNESINAKLEAIFKNSEKQVGEFVKMARWKDTNFWSVKSMVDKTRKVLHKALREYKKAIAAPCRQYFIDEGTSNQEEQEKIHTIEKVLVKAFRASAPRLIRSVKNFKQEDIGSYDKLSSQAFNISVKINKRLTDMKLIDDIAELTPNIVTEMEKLQKLTVDASKSKEEQKKQAGFIQQRKRKALNDLFKTLQGLGLSYRHGLINTGDMGTNQELFHKLDQNIPLWTESEKYFFR